MLMLTSLMKCQNGSLFYADEIFFLECNRQGLLSVVSFKFQIFSTEKAKSQILKMLHLQKKNRLFDCFRAETHAETKDQWIKIFSKKRKLFHLLPSETRFMIWWKLIFDDTTSNGWHEGSLFTLNDPDKHLLYFTSYCWMLSREATSTTFWSNPAGI